MTTMVILFIVSFICLWKGADWLVTGASAISTRLGIPEFLIGLTVLAFGTSAPELFVNIIASINNESDITLGNILGSNIANLFLILGISGVISPLIVQRRSIKFEIPVSLICIGLIWFFFSIVSPSLLTSLEAIILLIIFTLFLTILVIGFEKTTDVPDALPTSLGKAILLTVAGMILLPLGGKWVIESTIYIASYFSIPKAWISLIAIAFGTSLPELVTSIMASLKRQSDLVMGNIIGSNIFNLLLILGVSGIITPITFSPSFLKEIYLFAGGSGVLLILLVFSKNHELKKGPAWLFLATYFVYLATLIH